MKLLLLTALILATFASCDSRTPSDSPSKRQGVYRDEVRFGLTFEERMAIPSALSVVQAEARAEADESFPAFRSREDAIKNEELAAELTQEKTAAFREEKGLTQEQLNQIVAEYQLSLGAPLR